MYIFALDMIGQEAALQEASRRSAYFQNNLKEAFVQGAGDWGVAPYYFFAIDFVSIYPEKSPIQNPFH
jgi:hypothetical protein